MMLPTISIFKDNFEEYCNQVVTEREIIIVSISSGKRLVLLSEEMYNQLLKQPVTEEMELRYSGVPPVENSKPDGEAAYNNDLFAELKKLCSQQNKS